MIGRLSVFFALAALIINRLFSRRQKRVLREVAEISAWVLLGAAAATLFGICLCCISNTFRIRIDGKCRLKRIFCFRRHI